jgi:CRISPR-associated protein Csb2
VSTTLAFTFPLGRYHANPWNRAVNEGVTEWPPSPWRILRALVATWHARWPDLPAPVLDGLLEALADPPSYQTPPAVTGHTRHYMPNLEYKRGLSDGKAKRPTPDKNDPSGKEMTLDPFLSVDPEAELLVRWDADLDDAQREVLAKLAELMPYLGRSESLCEARLADQEFVPDESWWLPGGGQVRLLTITRPVSRANLEATTTDVRKRRRALPPGTTWTSYAEPVGEMPRDRLLAARDPGVAAVRFEISGQAPLKATHGVLLADRVHKMVEKPLGENGVLDARRKEIMGTNGAATDHQHAHWIPVPESGERGAAVKSFVVWMPSGLQTSEVQALLDVRRVGRWLGDYEVKGLPELSLLFQGAGTLEQVAPELCREARTWRSITPYLPVRHQKRESADEFLFSDVAAELRYRNNHYELINVTRVHPGLALTDRWAIEFRRHRLNEKLQRSRPGMRLQLEFAEPVPGPLLLGQLSHFGFGIFEPVDS